MCPFDCTAVAGSRKVGPVNQVNHTIWLTVVTQTYCAKSVHKRCVIERFGGVFVLLICLFYVSVPVEYPSVLSRFCFL